MGQQITLLVGTTKGAFFYTADAGRLDWQMTGPHLGGWEIYSLLGDDHDGGRVFAGTSHYVYGPTIRVTADGGATWEQVAAGPRYEQESGFRLKRIWQIVPGGPAAPDTLYAGVEEAGLFVSRDQGTTWTELSGLTAHPTRPQWFPGAGGLCLHTILPDPADPARLWVAISAVGVFRTEDGGKTWEVCNKGLPEVPTGMEPSEVGRCVHKIVLDPANPNTLYMQFHGGVLRSTDGADSWQPIEAGLPGNFGFPMGASARGDLFVVPLTSEEGRYDRDGMLPVYRSQDRGASWAATRQGLPTEPEYVGVLRDALTVDALEPAGVYFGTTQGDLFYSRDAGDTWQRLPGRLPRITAVKTWLREV